MSDKSVPQHARVESPFDGNLPTVHCPICGKSIRRYDEKEGEAGIHYRVTPCSHLAFAYDGGDGGFEHQSQDFKKRCENLDAEGIAHGAIRKLLKDARYGNELLVLEITHGGVACAGRVTITDVYGFDYAGGYRT